MFAYAYSQYEVPEPEELANNQISSIYASDNSTQIARIVPPEGNRTQVSLEAIPDHVENAVLAAEDREFWTNSGFSFTGFARAVIGQLTGNDSAGGGSTVTQQYVKNTLVGNEVSYIRKARELVYSIKMTNEWPKEDILNAYLNTVYFGRNAYGIQAASVAYFDKNVEDLTVEEGAMLAGIIQAPSNWDPAVNAQQSEERWNYVLDGMVEIEALPAEQRAGMQFPHTEEPSSVSAYTQATGANAHIKNQVIAELEEVGITEDQVNTRGLRITTTIDPTVQNASVDAVDSNLAPLQEDARAAAVTIDPSTGAVRGYFGGDEAEGWDYANGPTETGSTFKIMALAAALQQGIP
ncbi:transglycosylase domain-containing protein, partial [Corynebacterium casei]